MENINTTPSKAKNHEVVSTKIDQLAPYKETSSQEKMTSNQGLKIQDDQNSLKSGVRGPTLLEDFHFREKMTHFDHERIPERVVHARGSAAHGYFQAYGNAKSICKAGFLSDLEQKTPVFVRFSTVVGSRGSTDLARDVRGFAVKFYTKEGNFDLVGNNIPVFFIQDAMKFPDLVHAIKPEPDAEIPQASSAHDTFWDFISLMPESLHMIMWLMSDRAIPRSYRMMEGFGVNTFKLINESGQSVFVKFHWKPTLGVHSVLWDEALKISGVDPDFHRRDLWEAIEMGDFPEWELGVQVVEESAANDFDFDLLDATKLIPEEVVPVVRIGKLVLNRNPDNFFAETEQVAFHPGNLVSGIDFSSDPLLQGRLFSYTDTQLIRLGGPNFHEIPINRSIAPVHNGQRDGFMRQTINQGRVSYEPNSLLGGCPFQVGLESGGFVSERELLEGIKERRRGPKYFDHFTQASLFYLSQTETEKKHIASALKFELGKVEVVKIQERMLFLLAKVDLDLAVHVGKGLGLEIPEKVPGFLNQSVPADSEPHLYQPTPIKEKPVPSPALSIIIQAQKTKSMIISRKVAILAADGYDDHMITSMKSALVAEGAHVKIVAPHHGIIVGAQGSREKVDYTLLTATSVLFDAVFVPGGESSVSTLLAEPQAVWFVAEAFRHCKAIALSGLATQFLVKTGIDVALRKDLTKDEVDFAVEAGVVVAKDTQLERLSAVFIESIGHHRFWEREDLVQLPV